ncbi:hypothetical protein [Rhodococcoides fascians]|uniref:hypothetical protein n=1 Tax=Rhodococcoides fascians TaxID=1828 RepID=UPI00050CF5B1|nr:hypothetical protein [Rhodococcus fascians]
MAFNRKFWKGKPDKTTPITADEMNRIEAGIDDAVDIDELNAILDGERSLSDRRYAPAAPVALPQDWAHWGDSMTSAGSSGNWVTKLAAVTGRSHYNGGVGGQSIAQIASRQGGIPALCTVAGNSIPASGSIAVTTISRTPVDPNGSIVGVLAGVAGTLTRDSGMGHSFTRTAAGSVTAVPAATPFVTSVSTANRDRKFTIAVGRNGFKGVDPASIVAGIRAMREFQTHPQGFVFEVPPWSTEPLPAASGSFREQLNTLNSMIKAAFPAEYFNGFELLRTSTAARAAGITFTSDDQTDITNGVTPRSLRSDEGHLNDLGGTALLYFLQKAAFDRGFIQTEPVLPAPPPAALTNLVRVPDPTLAVPYSGGTWNTVLGSGTPSTGASVIMSLETVTGAPRGKAVRCKGVAGMNVQPLINVGGGSAPTRADIVGGKTYTSSMYVRASKAMTLNIWTRDYTSTASSDIQGTPVALEANTWTRLSHTWVATTDSVSAAPRVLGAVGSLSDESYIEATAAMITEGATLRAYADGASSGWAWSGTAGMSTSSGPIL